MGKEIDLRLPVQKAFEHWCKSRGKKVTKDEEEAFNSGFYHGEANAKERVIDIFADLIRWGKTR